MNRTIATAVPVWLSVAIVAVIVAMLMPVESWWSTLPMIAAGAMLLTFVIQVSLQSKDGLVTRMLVSVSGAFVVLGVASVITLVVTAFSQASAS